jgi:hypothetical protein
MTNLLLCQQLETLLYCSRAKIGLSSMWFVRDRQEYVWMFLSAFLLGLMKLKQSISVTHDEVWRLDKMDTSQLQFEAVQSFYLNYLVAEFHLRRSFFTQQVFKPDHISVARTFCGYRIVAPNYDYTPQWDLPNNHFLQSKDPDKYRATQSYCFHSCLAYSTFSLSNWISIELFFHDDKICRGEWTV